MTPAKFLRRQADTARASDTGRDRLAERLGLTRRELDALLAASALNPGITWSVDR